MKELSILITGTNPDIMKVILRLLNSKEGWTGHTAFSVEEAITKSGETTFDVVLIGAGISDDEAKQIEAYFYRTRDTALWWRQRAAVCRGVYGIGNLME